MVQWLLLTTTKWDDPPSISTEQHPLFQDLHKNHTGWSIWSGEIIIFHEPRFPWIKGISSATFWGENSCEVAIIWPDMISPTSSPNIKDSILKWGQPPHRKAQTTPLKLPNLEIFKELLCWCRQAQILRKVWKTRFFVGSSRDVGGVKVKGVLDGEDDKNGISVMKIIIH